MNPWKKERRLKAVFEWMYGENPDIWYTPWAITEQNPHAPKPSLSIDEAKEIFKELSRRKALKDVYPKVTYSDNGSAKTETIAAWQIDQNQTVKTLQWVRKRGVYSDYIAPILNLWWTRREKVILFILFIAGTFLTGFFTRLGETACDKLCGILSDTKTEARQNK